MLQQASKTLEISSSVVMNKGLVYKYLRLRK
jgi:hypothetical protein